MFYFLMNRDIFCVFFCDVSEFHFILEKSTEFASVANQDVNADMLLSTENVTAREDISFEITDVSVVLNSASQNFIIEFSDLTVQL